MVGSTVGARRAGPEVNYLIGSRGVTIMALQDASQCKLQVQRSHELAPGARTRTVTISGTATRRKICADMVKAKVDE